VAGWQYRSIWQVFVFYQHSTVPLLLQYLCVLLLKFLLLLLLFLLVLFFDGRFHTDGAARVVKAVTDLRTPAVVGAAPRRAMDLEFLFPTSASFVVQDNSSGWFMFLTKRSGTFRACHDDTSRRCGEKSVRKEKSIKKKGWN
jgi:hypothetical protein